MISEPTCPQFWKKCLHAPPVPCAAFSSSEWSAWGGQIFKVFCWPIVSPNQAILSTFIFFQKFFLTNFLAKSGNSKHFYFLNQEEKHIRISTKAWCKITNGRLLLPLNKYCRSGTVNLKQSTHLSEWTNGVSHRIHPKQQNRSFKVWQFFNNPQHDYRCKLRTNSHFPQHSGTQQLSWKHDDRTKEMLLLQHLQHWINEPWGRNWLKLRQYLVNHATKYLVWDPEWLINHATRHNVWDPTCQPCNIT